MVSASTILRTDSGPGPGGTGTLLSPNEPELIRRERSALGEILRLVAERADAEAKVEAERASSGTTADTEYTKARKALVEKFQRLETEAHADDEKRRRSIIDAALKGEATSKSEFAAGSRKIATLFDSHRDTTKVEYNRAKNEAVGAFDSGQKKAAREHAEKSKPIDDSAAMADAFRERLAFLAAENKKFKLSTEIPGPTRESYDKFADPGDELFTRLARMETPLKLLEGLIIPKSMKGGREAWVFIALILPLVGIAIAYEGGEIGIGAAAVAGLTLAVLLRTWLVKLSKSQLERYYTPLVQTLSDADGLTAHCRGLVDARLKEERKRVTAQRDEGLKRAEDEYRNSITDGEIGDFATSGSARSTKYTPSGWSTFRQPSNATCALPSKTTTVGWPSSGLKLKSNFPGSRINTIR